MRFSVYQESLTGGRRNNQDRVAYSYSKEALLLVLADGLGGHTQGEVAAEITVEIVMALFRQQARPVLPRPLAFLADSMTAAHAALARYTEDNGLSESPRTTCVACVIQNSRAYWVHVGDSRLYHVRGGSVIGVTNDHSRVQRLVNEGFMSAEEAATHPQRNMIYACIGGLLEPRFELGSETALLPGDALLLSSDGFWAQIPRSEIEQVLSVAPVTQTLPGLMRAALQRGGAESDNLSVVGVTWGSEQDNVTGGSISTRAMSADHVTEFNSPFSDPHSGEDGREDDIERTVAEIRNTVKQYMR
jgi:PPM family protein phosphatase